MQRSSRSTLILAALVFSLPAFAQDTLKVNPDSVTLKFENDRVRVLESVLRPGARENQHSHPNYVTYAISGGEVLNHSKGAVSPGGFKNGEILFRDARTHWSENTGKTTIRVIMIELKDFKGPGEAYTVPPDRDPVKVSPQYYKVRFENEFVRVLEYRLPPGQKEATHSHPCRVVYDLTSAKLRVRSGDGQVMQAEGTAGEIAWSDPLTHSLENVGQTDVRAIAIELKGPCPPAAK